MNTSSPRRVGTRAARPDDNIDTAQRCTRVDGPESQRPTLDDSNPLLTVIVPVYNEAATIDRLLAAVVDAPYPKQIVVIDRDG